MRILQLHNHHQSRGGAMEVLAHEAELLTQAGHEVTEYTLPSAEELALPALRAGLKAIWNVETSKAVAARIEEFGPDVVHVHTPFPLMSPAVFRTAKAHGVPTVNTLHSYRWSCIAATCFRDNRICEDCVGSRLKLSGVRHRCYHGSAAGSAALTAGLLLHRAIGTQAHKVDRYLALTPFARRMLIREGLPADKIVVKPNSMPDPGEPGEPADPPYVAFVGRLIDVKGIATLLAAWPLATPGVRLVIAGDGPMRPEVEAAAAADPTIEFRGWIPEAEVGPLMGGALAVVMPSEWYEGLPLVILRSLAVGTPLIVTDLENFAEDVLADGAGTAFALGNPAALASQLSDVVANRQAWLDRRAPARRSYLARYTEELDVRRLEAIYAEVTAGR